MRYGVAKHHVTLGGDNFTPGEVIPAKNLDAAGKKVLDRLVELDAVEITGETEADKAWEEANKKQQEEDSSPPITESITEESASDEQEAESEMDADEDMEELEPVELADDDIIAPDAEEEAPAEKPAAKRKAKKEEK